MSVASILSPAQRALLDRLSRSEFTRDFFLTGGTALAECYLHHRFSEDLDFFTGTPGRVGEGLRALEGCARELGAGFTAARTFGTFAECFLDFKEEVVT